MTFFKTAIAGAVFAASLTTGAVAEELKLAHFSSTKYPMHTAVFVPLSEAFGEATGGEVTIRIYPGGELGKGPAKQYDRVVDGIADIAYSLPGYTAAQFKQTLLVELPGIIPEGVNPTTRIWENIDMLDKEFRRTKLLGLWTAQEAMLLSREKPITSLSDLEGMKIRVPSRNTGRVIEAWGATPVSMPITEVYTSMETGVIDGVLVDVSVLSSFNLGEVTAHITTGMNSTNSLFMMVMNRDSWDGLSEEHQQMLTGLTGQAMSEDALVAKLASSDDALAAWIEAGGVVTELPAEAAAEFNAAAEAVAATVIDELEAEGVNAAAWAEALGN